MKWNPLVGLILGYGAIHLFTRPSSVDKTVNWEKLFDGQTPKKTRTTKAHFNSLKLPKIKPF
jgi:hypothetical protein